MPFHGLADLPLVLPNPRNSLRQRLEAIAVGCDMALTVRFEVGAMVPMKTLVAEGMAVMLASIEVVRTELAAGTLSAAPLRDPVIRRALHLAGKQPAKALGLGHAATALSSPVALQFHGSNSCRREAGGVDAARHWRGRCGT